MNKFIISIIFFCACAAVAQAKVYNAVVVHLTTERQVIYLFDEKPVMVFKEKEIAFRTKTDTISYGLEDIVNFDCGYFDPSEYLPGDVTGNLNVTIEDATVLIDYLNGRNTISINTKNADVNKNGAVDVDDVKKIVQIISKLSK